MEREKGLFGKIIDGMLVVELFSLQRPQRNGEVLLPHDKRHIANLRIFTGFYKGNYFNNGAHHQKMKK